MSELRLGDMVQSKVGHERIMMFTHENAHVMYKFVRLHAGNESVTVTKGHYIYTKSGLKKGGDVKVGEWVVRKEGLSQVWKRETVIERGLYNPHTGSGTMYVDGFLSSCYTEAVDVASAHSALSVVRWSNAVFERRWVQLVCKWVGQVIEHVASGGGLHLQRKGRLMGGL